MRDDYYVYDGTEFEKTEEPDLQRLYVGGLFGYRMVQIGSINVPIEACYPSIISTRNAYYHLVSEQENKVAHIVAELPRRYSVEQCFNNISEIANSIMPQSIKVEVSLSAKGRKTVK